jgi:hypothetical protein
VTFQYILLILLKPFNHHRWLELDDYNSSIVHNIFNQDKIQYQGGRTDNGETIGSGSGRAFNLK